MKIRVGWKANQSYTKPRSRSTVMKNTAVLAIIRRFTTGVRAPPNPKLVVW